MSRCPAQPRRQVVGRARAEQDGGELVAQDRHARVLEIRLTVEHQLSQVSHDARPISPHRRQNEPATHSTLLARPGGEALYIGGARTRHQATQNAPVAARALPATCTPPIIAWDATARVATESGWEYAIPAPRKKRMACRLQLKPLVWSRLRPVERPGRRLIDAALEGNQTTPQSRVTRLR